MSPPKQRFHHRSTDAENCSFIAYGIAVMVRMTGTRFEASTGCNLLFAVVTLRARRKHLYNQHRIGHGVSVFRIAL